VRTISQIPVPASAQAGCVGGMNLAGNGYDSA
jgi:hypothetical protein